MPGRHLFRLFISGGPHVYVTTTSTHTAMEQQFLPRKSHRKEGYSSGLWRARSLVLACELAFLDDVVLRGEVLTLEVPVQHVPHTLGIPQLHGLFVSRRTSQIWSKVKTE